MAFSAGSNFASGSTSPIRCQAAGGDEGALVVDRGQFVPAPVVEARLADPVLAAQVGCLLAGLVLLQDGNNLLSVCLLRFIVWSFLKARLQFTLDQFKGATSPRSQRRRLRGQASRYDSLERGSQEP
jgi:hypothetical protein